MRFFFFLITGKCFIHIPKCAGTSYSKKYYGVRLGHKTYKELKRLCRTNTEFIFIFREPIERLDSAIRFSQAKGHHGGYHDKDILNLTSLIEMLSRPEIEIDPIFQSQSYFIEGLLENEKNISIGLMEKNKITWLNSSQQKDVKIFNKTRNFNPHQNHFSLNSKELKEIVNKYYYKDIHIWEQLKIRASVINSK